MKVVIVGYGTVGKSLHALINAHSEFELSHIYVRKEKEQLPLFSNSLDILNDADIVFECLSGTDPADTVIRTALTKGKHVITSNKMVVSANLDDYIELQNKYGSTLQIEACVAGGIPFLDELLKTNKVSSITGFEGILNGTCNYILDSIFSKGMNFDESLKNAQELGYAERDPKNDIEGFDVAYKTMIANSLAYSCGISGIPLVRGINTISKEDIAFAKENGMVIRHLAVSQTNRTEYDSWILPAFIKEGSFFSSIRRNYNAQIIHNKTNDCIHLAGQGAGGFPTASAMLSNAFDALNNTIHSIQIKHKLHPAAIIQNDIVIRDANGYRIMHNANRNDIELLVKEKGNIQFALWRDHE